MGTDDLFGTDPHMLHRRDAPDTSVAAAHTVDTANDEERVFEFIKAAGSHGTTLKELQPLMQKDRSAFSGRISALLRKGLVEDVGDRRDGCRVVRLKQEDRSAHPVPSDSFAYRGNVEDI